MQVLADFWEVIARANANQVIAAFTVVIGVTTIIYTLMTLRLFRLSRWAFLVDTLIRITQRTQEQEDRYLRQMAEELTETIEQVSGADTEELKKARMRWEEIRALVETEPYVVGLAEAIEGINKKLGVDLSKAFMDYMKTSRKDREHMKRRMESFRNELVALAGEALKQAKKGKSEGV